MSYKSPEGVLFCLHCANAQENRDWTELAKKSSEAWRDGAVRRTRRLPVFKPVLQKNAADWLIRHEKNCLKRDGLAARTLP